MYGNNKVKPGESMIFFKSCPRCVGDQALERDSYGWYVICLGCGHVSYPDLVGLPQVPSTKNEQMG